jgi:hypothetical protein
LGLKTDGLSRECERMLAGNVKSTFARGQHRLLSGYYGSGCRSIAFIAAGQICPVRKL